jgi:serine/threonine protein kinase
LVIELRCNLNLGEFSASTFIVKKFFDKILSNILVTKEFVIKLADFNISRKNDTETLTSNRGTLGYMSPEMSGGKYSSNTDIWSAGCVIFELIFLKQYIYYENNSNNKSFKEMKPRILIELVKM